MMLPPSGHRDDKKSPRLRGEESHHIYKILVMVLKALIGILVFGALIQSLASRT
ncbi:hypothetical protein ACSYAY_07470 [Leptospirillum ferriphilum]|uniref:hypothetical protein n=1 Tax=Leptospirillum ferriphilum TaxID=178606 RepID=UPI003EE4A8F1